MRLCFVPSCYGRSWFAFERTPSLSLDVVPEIYDKDFFLAQYIPKVITS